MGSDLFHHEEQDGYSTKLWNVRFSDVSAVMGYIPHPGTRVIASATIYLHGVSTPLELSGDVATRFLEDWHDYINR